MIQETAHSALGAWESFYVIVGSSAAALTGLQFVVITLVSEARRQTSALQIDAFSTPTIVHFCVALFISATLSAPWSDLFGAAFVIAISGVFGIVYTAIVLRRANRQAGYTLVAEDWTWHVILPLVAYVAQVGGGLALTSAPHMSLFFIAGTALLLVFIGIHNAWDTTTYVAANPELTGRNVDDGKPAEDGPGPAVQPPVQAQSK